MILVHCDGAISGGNPGGWAVGGYIIKIINKEMTNVVTGTIDLGRGPDMTNNIAEYAAVFAALFRIKKLELTDKPIVVKTDSMLVVQHLTGRWNCADIHLRAFKKEIQDLTKDFQHVEYHWIPREKNTEADAVSKSLY